MNTTPVCIRRIALLATAAAVLWVPTSSAEVPSKEAPAPRVSVARSVLGTPTELSRATAVAPTAKGPNSAPAIIHTVSEVYIERLRFHDVADFAEDLTFSIKLVLLDAEKNVIGTVAYDIGHSVTVQEMGALGYWKDGVNQFPSRVRARIIQRPVAYVRAQVTVHSLDGDGLRWGTNVETAPAGHDLTFYGGNDGRWELVFGVMNLAL